MSHRLPKHMYERDFTFALGPFTATIPDGINDGSTAAATSPSEASVSSESTSSVPVSTSKDATTSATPAPSSSSLPTTTVSSTSSSSLTTAASSTSVSSSTIAISPTSTSLTSTKSTIIPSAPAATTAIAPSTPHLEHTPAGLVAFAVLACLAFVGALTWVLLMRRHHKQREWTFQQHRRIFDERFHKGKDDSDGPDAAHYFNNSNCPPASATVVDDGKAWSAGTGASMIVVDSSVDRNVDWDGEPDPTPKAIVKAKPERKPVPPPKEFKKKTFSQYLPYLLPQHHDAEVIELSKAQQQVYQKPPGRPAG